MAQPIWITPAGSLGSIPEGIFYSTPLVATDPEANTVYYELIAGSLPPGIQINETGILTGVPKSQATIQGVPLDVTQSTTSKFAIRAYTTTTVGGITIINRLADRTFTLTITNPGAPEFITPAGLIDSLYDGTQLSGLQIEYTESNLATTRVSLRAGSLPPGLTINSTGLISGIVYPLNPVNSTQGFSRDGQGYDQYPFDFNTVSSSETFEFVLEVSNGRQSNLRAYSITVYSRNELLASTSYITADNSFITADGNPTNPPIITTPTGSLGTTENDNFYAFQFEGIDLSGDVFEFIVDPDPPIPGLTLDPNSGWLYGYIPNLGLTEITYNFNVYARKKYSPSIISRAYNYSLLVTGAINTNITWLTDSNLGTINNGDISQLSIKAITAIGIPLQYRLKSGSPSSLPQGLELLPTGDIVGRVSFNTFALDGGTTTFDVNNNNTNKIPTTFDMTFTFTVEAYGGYNGAVDVFKTFTVTVNRKYNEPYENLYVQVMPPADDRVLIQNLLQSTEIFPVDMLYRKDDPWFGRAQSVIYQHAYGLTSATYADYVSSLYLNHYWKNLVLGEIKTAQALDDAGNVIYEVVYSEIIDNLVNAKGQSVDKIVPVPYAIDPNTPEEIDDVYPNSLINMRTQVIDTVGQISNVLPRWMLSKQKNGTVLGFTPAWVLCYTKPGYSGQIQYNIQTMFGDQLNLVDFKVDRYELDHALSIHWDSDTISYNITNIVGDGNMATATFNTQPSAPFAIGQEVKISGVVPIGFNKTVYVASCTASTFTFKSSITTPFVSGGIVSTVPHWVPAPAETYFDGGITLSYSQWINDNLDLVNWINSYSSTVTWTNDYIGPTSRQPTIFDGGSMKFIDPVDMYTGTTTDYDKYLVFPKTNILG